MHNTPHGTTAVTHPEHPAGGFTLDMAPKQAVFFWGLPLLTPIALHHDSGIGMVQVEFLQNQCMLGVIVQQHPVHFDGFSRWQKIHALEHIGMIKGIAQIKLQQD
ncbi:hypothetical protein [Lampropedia hyalina]|uniref:hypothetical protein n=1 Tax=Lampropedia hyalina TaxID=198706 RepID=UPI001356368A|nr:hypothetical protein [Lampropedia hyalina]